VRLLDDNRFFAALLVVILIGPTAIAVWLGTRAGQTQEEIAASSTAVTQAGPVAPSEEEVATSPTAELESTPAPTTPASDRPTAEAQAEPEASAEVIAAFNAGACGGCHTIPGVPGAVGQVGPDLSNLGAEAADRRSGYTAEEYIRESILDPNAFIAPNCPTGDCPSNLMPPNFKETLSPEQVEMIVNYLMTLSTER